ncbi:MAG: hypothetical protein JO147_06030 [Actinobacteria bacterium]|nr:hypothetical protein [Actinomycetota bacterium]
MTAGPIRVLVVSPKHDEAGWPALILEPENNTHPTPQLTVTSRAHAFAAAYQHGCTQVYISPDVQREMLDGGVWYQIGGIDPAYFPVVMTPDSGITADRYHLVRAVALGATLCRLDHGFTIDPGLNNGQWPDTMCTQCGVVYKSETGEGGAPHW